MTCKHCGYEIDTKKRRPDGSIQCPNCKAVYRPRTKSPTPTAKPVKKDNSFVGIIKSIPWKKKIWKFPLWAWVVLIVIIIGAFGYDDSNTNNAYTLPAYTQQSSETSTAAPTLAPSAEPDATEWAKKFEQTEPDVLKYISDKLNGVYEIKELGLDYHVNEIDVYDVFLGIFAGTTEADIKTAIKYIEDTLTEYKCNFFLQFWKDDYTIRFSVTVGKDFNYYSSKGNTYETLDELVIPAEE